MNFRSPLIRVTLFVALALVVVSALSAATEKRRAVVPGQKTVDVDLNGTVVDADTGAPVVGVDVSATGRTARTDTKGLFTIKVPTGSVTINFSRTGYAASSVTVNLSAATTQTFHITSLPTVKVIAGATTYQVEPDSVEFGYIAPFSGYVQDTKLNLCTSGGVAFAPDRSEIRKITPGAALNDPACCSKGSIPAINVELKTGGTSTGGFTDACLGYKVDIIAIDHNTEKPVYIHFSDITEVDFP
jgi:hypothetical protein